MIGKEFIIEMKESIVPEYRERVLAYVDDLKSKIKFFQKLLKAESEGRRKAEEEVKRLNVKLFEVGEKIEAGYYMMRREM